MADILGSSPVARTVDLTRTQFSGLGLGSKQSSLVPLIKGIQQKNDFQDKFISQEQVQLNVISSQLTDFAAQMRDINGALQRIAYYIAQDTSLDLSRERQKQKQDFILAQSAARFGKESLLERKIQSAISKPIAAIYNKTQNALSNLAGVFTTLFLGWLTTQGINAIRAYSQGATNTLEKIKDSVLSGFRVFLGIGRIINKGIGGIISSVSEIAVKLGKFIVKDLIGGIFRGIFNLGKGLIDGAKNLLSGGERAAESAATRATTTTAEKALAETAEKTTAKATEKGATRIGLGAFPILGAAPDLAFSAIDFSQGKWEAGLLGLGAAGASLLGLEPLSIGLSVAATVKSATTPSNEERKTAEQAKSKAQKPAQSAPTAAKVPPKKFTPQSQPQSQAPKSIATMSSSGAQDQQQTSITKNNYDLSYSYNPNFKLNASKDLQGSMAKDANATSTGVTFNQTNFNLKNEDKTPAKIAPMDTKKMEQQKTQNIGPLPEPKPNVIVAPLPAQQKSNDAAASSAPSREGMINPTPVISSSNPDNFYSLYSQISYNVVM